MEYIQLSKTKLSKIYGNMMNRCYNEGVQRRKPYYVGVTVCDEWKNDSETFYDWVNDGHFYEIEGEPSVELDHDILVKGNKVYSPETAIFVPKSINSLFGGSHKKADNGLPQGIKQLKSGKYKPIIEGYSPAFDTVEEAFEVYKRFKEARIIETARQYAKKIPRKLFDAMVNWEVEITD